jgi:hypothetical protein
VDVYHPIHERSSEWWIERARHCKRKIEAAKSDIRFWSGQLRESVDVLSENKQLNFEHLLNGD